jgi:hypothetical protein
MLPRAMLRYPDAADVAQVTTATEGGVAVFATVPVSPGSAIPGTAPPGLYACTLVPGNACELRDSNLPDGVTALATAAPLARRDGILIAVLGGMLRLSYDGGRSFTAAQPVPAAGILSTVSVADGQVWAVAAARDRQTHRVVDFDIASGLWRDVTGAHPALNSDGVVVAVTGQVILDAMASGVLCTANAGASWLSHCSAGG